MPVFTPCVAVSKAKLSAAKVADGQLIVVLDSGEIYFDYNNRRIQLAKNTSAAPAENTGNPFIFCIVNADTKVSGSLAAGGGGTSGGSGEGGGGDGGDGADDPPVYADSYGTPLPITPEFTECRPAFPIVHGNLSI